MAGNIFRQKHDNFDLMDKICSILHDSGELQRPLTFEKRKSRARKDHQVPVHYRGEGRLWIEKAAESCLFTPGCSFPGITGVSFRAAAILYLFFLPCSSLMHDCRSFEV